MKIEGLSYFDSAPISIEFNTDTIVRIDRIEDADSEVYIAPGFVDNQVNGCFGVDFSGPKLTPEDVVKATKALWRTGVTTYFPTIVTCSPELVRKNASIIAAAAQNEAISGCIAGIHLEGPYISPLDGFRGAHNLKWVRQPDWDELQRVNEAAQGLVRQVTLAPEGDGAIGFIESCTMNGIVAALGHHNGTTDQIRRAVDAGAKIATHLGNGLSNKIDRHRNPLWPQLAEERLTVSLIGDGFHLTPEELKVFFRVKGPEHIMLTSDITLLSGLPPGVYEWDGAKIEMSPEGQIFMPSQNVLAGASLPLSVGVGNMMRFADCTPAEAVHLASRNQAGLFGFTDRGELLPGKRADVVLFSLKEKKLDIVQTIVGGRIVFKKE